ncbi:hypothetical protein RUM43_008837 [Polyplax serrata]|uniref:Uncharacterized protein n=1 Tax=Polyplax serrata TaxID=468196 RepID=A0AAN8S446_POLSC
MEAMRKSRKTSKIKTFFTLALMEILPEEVDVPPEEKNSTLIPDITIRFLGHNHPTRLRFSSGKYQCEKKFLAELSMITVELEAEGKRNVYKNVYTILGANQTETSKLNPHYQAGNNSKDETCETFGEIPWAVVSERSRADFNCSPETQAKFFDYALGRFGLEFRDGGSVRETERKQGLLHLYNAENKRRFGGPLNGIFQHFPNVMGH